MKPEEIGGAIAIGIVLVLAHRSGLLAAVAKSLGQAIGPGIAELAIEGATPAALSGQAREAHAYELARRAIDRARTSAAGS